MPRPRLSGVAVALLVTGMVVLVGSFMTNGWWWKGGEVTVPRDGDSHVVTLSEPGGDYAIWSDQSLIDPGCALTDADGTPIPLRRVPETERIYVDTMGIAKPEASFLFTAPQSDSVTVTCDSIQSTPVSTLDLGAAPHRVVFALLNWGLPLLGLGMLLVGLVLLAGAGVRELRWTTARPDGAPRS